MLTWKGRVTIRQARHGAGGVLKLDDVKTEGSAASVPLPRPLVAVLKGHRRPHSAVDLMPNVPDAVIVDVRTVITSRLVRLADRTPLARRCQLEERVSGHPSRDSRVGRSAGWYVLGALPTQPGRFSPLRLPPSRRPCPPGEGIDNFLGRGR